MLFFIIIITLILILTIPIPLKFSILFLKDDYYIKFYNINIVSKDTGILNNVSKRKKPSKKKVSKVDSIKDSDSKKLKNRLKNKIQSLNSKKSLKNIYKAIYNNKFKIHLKLNNEITYSLGDAARTATSCGALYCLNPMLFYILSIIFKVKSFKNDFKPIFKDDFLFELRLNCIITFSLAQIIYMVFIILKSIIKNQEVTP